MIEPANSTSRPGTGILSGAGGFIAGVLATLVFHQGMLAILHGIGLTPAMPYSLHPTAPLGVPAVLSLAFWGGVWGVILASIEPRFPRGVRYWITALLFGAIAPTLVAWFVVAPLKGLPVAAGWRLPGMATSVITNAAWAVGTALLLRLWYRGLAARSARSPVR